ncbi:Copia protein, partial [Mucuna pruriens]
MSCLSFVKHLGNTFVFSIELIVLENTQEYGLDYDETSTLVAKMTIVCTILALVASQYWSLHQMNIKNAFLHSDLKEEVYIKLPNGMHISSPNTVCKLKCFLYGLKQAPRVWFENFYFTLHDFSFNQSRYDPSLFLQRTPKGIVVLLVYVDDIVVTGSNQEAISRIKHMLRFTLHMKELGYLTYFLGLELTELTNSTLVDTPLKVNVKYRRDENDIFYDLTLYCKLIGSVIYLTITCSDVSFVVHTVSKFMQSSRYFHFSVVLDISLAPQTYSDVDWVGCLDTRKSTISWCMFLRNALISWKCKKQDSVSKSSTEAEYRIMFAACSKIIWLHGLLIKLEFPQVQPTLLHVDSDIQIIANPIYHERSKHIKVNRHSIREAYDCRVINLPHVLTSVQTTDIFTKI